MKVKIGNEELNEDILNAEDLARVLNEARQIMNDKAQTETELKIMNSLSNDELGQILLTTLSIRYTSNPIRILIATEAASRLMGGKVK